MSEPRFPQRPQTKNAPPRTTPKNHAPAQTTASKKQNAPEGRHQTKTRACKRQQQKDPPKRQSKKHVPPQRQKQKGEARPCNDSKKKRAPATTATKQRQQQNKHSYRPHSYRPKTLNRQLGENWVMNEVFEGHGPQPSPFRVIVRSPSFALSPTLSSLPPFLPRKPRVAYPKPGRPGHHSQIEGRQHATAPVLGCFSGRRACMFVCVYTYV